MDKRHSRAGDGGPGSAPNDDTTLAHGARSSGTRSSLARALHQNRAFHELARLIAAGEHGLWTGALSILLGPSGASWGVAYRLSGPVLELAVSEGLPVGLRANLDAFDLHRHSAFAACRAVRSRRAVNDERLFIGVVDARTALHLDTAGACSGTAVPIVYGGAVFGVLVVGAATREAIDADALTFLETATSLLAPALALLEARRPSTDTRTSEPPRLSSPPPPRKIADVSRATLDAIQQTGPLLRRMVTDIRSAVEEDCVAFGDASDVRVAVVHLVANAVEAAAERAPLSGVPSMPRRVRVTVTREAAAVAVCVEDSGRGVPPDMRSRVFEAGVTTKGRGRGNGLSLVRQIARDQGGHIEVGTSELGGASFRMVLPASLGKLESGDRIPSKRGFSATWPRFRAPSDRPSGKGGDGDDEGEPERWRA